MKSILLTSSPSSSSTSSSNSQSSSNNLSPLLSTVESCNNKSNRKVYKSVDDDDGDDNDVSDKDIDCVNETDILDGKEEYNANKLLIHSNNKSQVITSNNKIITKDNDKLVKKNIYMNADYERWKRNNNVDVNESDCFSLNLENFPLIDKSNVIVNDVSDNNYLKGKIIAANSTTSSISPSSTKLINLRKKNGTALIFQRKVSSNNSHSSCEYQDLEIESFKKRQSLQQWPQSNNNSKKFNKTRHYSWYDACNYTREPIEEEFENSSLTQFTNEHNNLAEIKTIIASSLLSINTASDDNVPDDSIIMKTSIDNSTAPPTTGATSKRWHNIEQFLKSLVGKRSSSSSATITSTTTSSVNAIANVVTSASTVNKSPSAYDLLPQPQQHQLQSQQKSSLCGSTVSLSNNNKDRLINKSTASLNSTSLALVHQKLWSVVPLLSRKDGGGVGSSCNNLLSNGNSSHSQMRKCETVLALTNDELCQKYRNSYQPIASTSNNSQQCNRRTHSKSINNLLDPMPMRPLNRLRNSQSCYVNCDLNVTRQAQNCSRCSSLLSLAAIGGSNYSLTNGAFVLKDGKHFAKHSKKTFSSNLIDEEQLLVSSSLVDNDGGVDDDDDSSSNHNLIENDFNSIEPYDAIKIALAAGTKFTCKLCLGEYFNEDKLTTISSCGCIFCTECMRTYVEFEISEGAYELSCPDALCSSQGVVSLAEISQLASSSLVAKHHRYRLNREVELDKYRLWCPNRNCETICSIPTTNDKLSPSTSSQSAIQQQPSSSSTTATLLLPRSVLCPTCNLEFCSSCKKAWHPSITCDENSKRLGSRNDSMMLFDNDLIKNCPMCAVPIEKDEGCAQMMCKRCKHVFCWYCLASLDDDFLLRHYDKGPCKNKLGHSRASVVWHRAQVIGIFAGFGILLLVASPLLLLAAPCIVCCKCKIEESTSTAAKLDEPDHHDHQV